MQKYISTNHEIEGIPKNIFIVMLLVQQYLLLNFG